MGKGTPVLVQDHYRIRDDTTACDPGTPNWVTTEDQSSTYTTDLDTAFRIRFVISNTGDGALTGTDNLDLRYSRNGGSYTAISGLTHTVWDILASSSADNTSLTTSNYQLTAGTGTAVGGVYREGSGGISNAPDNGEYLELEFGLNLSSVFGATSGDTFDYRIYLNGAAIDTYTVTPRVTASNSQAITPNLITFSQTFYTPTVTTTKDLSPSLYTNTQTFYTPEVQTLGDIAPALYTNTQTFHTPTVTAGAVNLDPALYTNTQTYYQHDISIAGSPQTLTPSLFTNSNTFPSATVTPGPVDLNPWPTLFFNISTFFAHTVTGGAVNLDPALYTNSNTFFSPTVSGGQFLNPSLYTNNQSFFTPTVTGGSVNLSPSLFTNSNSIFSATVAITGLLAPSLFSNTSSFYPATVSGSTSQFILPTLFTNTSIIKPYSRVRKVHIGTCRGLTVKNQRFELPNVIYNKQHKPTFRKKYA